MLPAALPERHRRNFCATTSIALSSGWRRLPRVDRCDARRERSPAMLMLMGLGLCVSRCRAAGESESNLARDYGATGNVPRHSWVNYPASYTSCMRQMTVTAATCSTGLCLHVTFAYAQLRSRSLSNACSQHYGSMVAGVAQPRYRWHVDSHAPDNVPHVACPCLRMHDTTS